MNRLTDGQGCLIVVALLLAPGDVLATTYDVGPDQQYLRIGKVPWFKLKAGDTVNIHWREQPYAEKVLVSSRGTKEKPIRIVGISGPGGEQPVITGENATTGPNMHYRWSVPAYQQALAVVSVGYRKEGPKPGYLEFSNLMITRGHAGNKFEAEDGSVQLYDRSSSGIHIYGAEHVTFAHMVLTENGNGLFAKSGGDETFVTRDISLLNSYIYNNGVRDSFRQHNVYTESDGVLIHGNRFGPLINGALGSILKDRSAGTVIRYNWIPAAARMLDLVEAEDGAPVLVGLKSYRQTFVYGNVFFTSGTDANMTRPIHYGSDGTPANSRGGTLYFYHNTFVIVRNQTEGWKMFLFETSTERDSVAAINNLIYVGPRTPGERTIDLVLNTGKGKVDYGANWVSPGWQTSFPGYAISLISDTQNLVSPPDNRPGFVDPARNDFRLVPDGSATRGIENLPSILGQNDLDLDLRPLEYYTHSTTTLQRSAASPLSFGALQTVMER